MSRRTFLAGTAVGALTAGLSACGGGSTDAPQAAGGAGFPVTVSGKEGDAVIPARPERVVATGRSRDAETALALGVVPVGMSRDATGIAPDGIVPWVLPALAGKPAPTLLESPNASVEQIAALRPDLILATDAGGLADRYRTLSEISPTVSYLTSPRGDTWQEATTRIGTALGRSAEATSVVGRVEQSVVAARDANPQFRGKTFTFGTVSDQVYTSLPGDSAVDLISSLGFTLSPAVGGLPATGSTRRAIVAAEQLSLLDADVLVLCYPSPDTRAAFEARPLFTRIPAVAQKRYVALPYDVAVGLAFPSALSIPYSLERSVAALRAAVPA